MIQLIRISDDLPDGFDALLADAASEGVRNMALLARDWASGDQRFDGEGEALLGALLAGELAGIGGLSVETASGEPARRVRRFYVRPAFRRQGVARSLTSAPRRRAVLGSAGLFARHFRALDARVAAEPSVTGRGLTRLVIAAIYVPFGVLHIIGSGGFLPIMPPMIPFPREIVIFTGVCEIVGAAGLLLPQTRRLAGIMLALYALCVWPANIYHALSRVSVPPLPSSWWYHGPRLLLQPVFIWAPLWAAGMIDWPFRRFTNPPGSSNQA